ncbi:MAG: SDR family oxidoreductase [Candidatus Omnitrophica bacterium]|nr:SDR family oxidoreductase [Candidatus Omnitrophota bacterium]
MGTALVTGASTGIGYELSKLLARDGYDLVLVARDKQKLLEVADELKAISRVSVKLIPKDLSYPSSPDEIFGELQRESIHIDILVNNAGVGSYGLFADSDLRNQLSMIQLNMTSLTHLTHLLLKEMLRKKKGKILNMASTAAFQPGGPLMAVYYATKAYVLSFSEALANELKGTGITVTVLCPGPTQTGFQEKARIGKSFLLSDFMVMDARKVARIGYKGLMKNKTIVIPGLKNKLTALGTKIFPRSIVTRMVRIFQEVRS